MVPITEVSYISDIIRATYRWVCNPTALADFSAAIFINFPCSSVGYTKKRKKSEESRDLHFDQEYSVKI